MRRYISVIHRSSILCAVDLLETRRPTGLHMQNSPRPPEENSSYSLILCRNSQLLVYNILETNSDPHDCPQVGAMTILGTKMSMVATCPMRRLARSEKTGTWEVPSDWQGCHNTKILRG